MECLYGVFVYINAEEESKIFFQFRWLQFVLIKRFTFVHNQEHKIKNLYYKIIRKQAYELF